MDIKLIRKLAELMNIEGLKAVKIADGHFSVELERDTGMTVVDPKKMSIIQEHQAQGASLPSRIFMPRLSRVAKTRSAAPTNGGEKQPGGSGKSSVKNFEIRSPLIGIFLSHMDGGASYVGIGKKVNKGDVLCLVEAGNQLHEITSDIEGEITEIMVRHGEEVKFDQIMFKIVSR